MNKRILMSSLSIFASLALATGATFAFFSDVGTSSNNVFAAGTFDLKLTDGNETDLDDVTQTWTGTNMAPGGATVDNTLRLRNSGTVAGNHVHLALTNSSTGAAMNRLLKIVTLEYDADGDGNFTDPGENMLGTIGDSNSNGFIDLDDWAALVGDHGMTGSIFLPLTDVGVGHDLHMVVQLDASATSAVEGQSVTSTFTATLHQAPAQ